MTDELSFSFVIPCLNAERTLKPCLEHCLQQRYSKSLIEIIVVDNGSTDKSQSIASCLADRLIEDPTATIARLRNLGADAASHDVIVFVDSDCLLPEEWLMIASQHFEDPAVAMVGAKTHLLPNTAGWVARAWKIHLDRSDLDPNPQWIVTRAMAVRKSIFEEVGGFDESLVTCEDVALGHAICKTHRIAVDSRLAPIHLEDSDTLRELFTKELWRGRDSIRTSLAFLKQSPKAWFGKEGISLLLPFYYLLWMTLLVLSIVLFVLRGQSSLMLLSLAAIVTPLFMLALDTCRKTTAFQWFPGLVVVYGTYILSRVGALFVSVVPKRRAVGHA